MTTREKPSLGKPTAVMLGAPVLAGLLALIIGLIGQSTMSEGLVWVTLGVLGVGGLAALGGFGWLVVNLWRR